MFDRKQYMKEWRQKNMEHVKQCSKEWFQKNKDYMRHWRQENKDKQKEYKRLWFQDHKEQQSAYRRRWEENNPGYRKAYNKEYGKKNLVHLVLSRRVRQLESDITEDMLLDLLRKQEFTCPYSGRQLTLGTNAALDHIYPRSRGGDNSIANLQWVDNTINRLKNAFTPDEFMYMVNEIYLYTLNKKKEGLVMDQLLP